MKKWLSEDVEVNLSTKSFMIILIVLGILIHVLVQNYIDLCCNTKENINTNYKIFLEIIKILSDTAISTGVLSLFLGITSIKSNLKECVIDTYKDLESHILSCDFNLSNYDNNTLNVLCKKIVVQQLNLNNFSYDKLDDTIYVLEKNLRDLIGLFYEYDEMDVMLIPDLRNNIIKKRVRMEYSIINYYKVENKIGFSIQYNKNKSLQKNDVNITHFQINGTVYDKEQIDTFTSVNPKEDSNGDTYYVFEFHKNLDHQCEKHVVYISLEYDLPIDDLTHSFKLPLPSKRMNHNFAVSGDDSSKWRLNTHAFTSWFNKNSPFEKEFRVIAHSPQSVEIKFNHWTLPGAGYVVSLSNEN